MSDTNPLELVRVKDPDGGEYTTTRAHAKNIGATVTDKQTVDDYGRILPAKTDPLRSAAAQSTVTEKSTHEELDAYATKLGVDLGSATTKNDKLAVIAAADHQEA